MTAAALPESSPTGERTVDLRGHGWKGLDDGRRDDRAATLLPWNKTANDSLLDSRLIRPISRSLPAGCRGSNFICARGHAQHGRNGAPLPGPIHIVPRRLRHRAGRARDQDGGDRLIASFARAASSTSAHRVEYVSQPNYIVEDVDPDPDIFDEQSVLDTLFTVVGGGVPNDGIVKPAMTPSTTAPRTAGPVVGLDIWTFRRTRCIALVDWVLHDLWGLGPGPDLSPALGGWGQRRALPTLRRRMMLRGASAR